MKPIVATVEVVSLVLGCSCSMGGRVVWLGEEEEREYGKGLIGCAAVSDGRGSEGLTGTIRFRTLVLLKNV